MKTLFKTLIVITLVLTASFHTSAQEYQDSLAPVYLTVVKKQDIKSSLLTAYNTELISLRDFRFSYQIKKAEKAEEVLVFFYEDSYYSIEKSEYLKMIRKAANRSESVTSFTNFIVKRLPQIETYLEQESTNNKLYEISRKNSLHGKLHDIATEFSL
ncbi:hypothetical protein [Ulvibacter antarcticus]|uniref:DUF4296 domain-containing protein n=1 Tax=Ulvibacter antarcticus TaxID=442714 RepID=A0A3L9YZW3_9FLAO|nr:hypothetical protein [Ulvibacter antarcticus]RMA66166.1 hypothetical protein BXY75_0585 [Ulvibacter antarcticus]